MKKNDLFSGSTLPNIFLICAAIFAVSVYFYKKNEDKKYLQEQIQKVRERRVQQRNEKNLNNQGGVPVFPDDKNTNTQNNQEEVEFQQNQEYQTQKQWVNCRDCHGTGTETCLSCKGKGEQNCRECNGKGQKDIGMQTQKTCGSCVGRGFKNCWDCGGRGTKGNCGTCDGRGQVQM
jgi:hypothetical protein